jgi:hypothetical protein
MYNAGDSAVNGWGGRVVTQIAIDPALQAKLTAPVELTDEAGRTLGYFISPQQFERIQQLEEDRKTLYEWANSLITDEELAAAEAEGGEYTTEEVISYLESLASSAEQAPSADPFIVHPRPVAPSP